MLDYELRQAAKDIADAQDWIRNSKWEDESRTNEVVVSCNKGQNLYGEWHYFAFTESRRSFQVNLRMATVTEVTRYDD